MSDTNTYNWVIAALEAYTTQSGYTDVVYTIHWRYRAVDQSTSYSAEVYGAQSVAPYNPDSGSFIPYDELTKPTVIGWLTGSLGEERVNALTGSLDAQIQQQIQPTSAVLPPPWDNPAPVPPEPTPVPPTGSMP
jgi:hypothetical protein